MVLVIGLTGGIGSGKTAVSDKFATLGITIADADIASRKVLEKNTQAYHEILDHFGMPVLDDNVNIDRAKLRSIVFADKSELKWLESITVPAILDYLKTTLEEADSPYAILMLSSGAGQSPWIDRNLVVDVSRETQFARVQARDNNSVQQIESIMASQPTREARLAYADDVLLNETDLSYLHQEVEKLHQQYLKLSATHKP